MGSKGLRSGESARLPPMWPEFESWRRRHMWVEFVVGSLSCFERFFSRYSSFPLFSKTNTSKFQFDQESGRRRTTLWTCYLQIIIYLFYYLRIYLQMLLLLSTKTLRAFSKTPLCNRPSEIYIFTGFSEKTSLGWFIFYWVFLLSCVLPIKAQRGGRPYIFTGMKILNTFYILL